MFILHRYQLTEQLKPLGLSIIGISLLFLSSILFEVGNYIVVKKVSPMLVLQLLVYKLPSVVVSTLPVATLFTTMFTLGRLAKDRELLIMRIAGMACHKIIIPYLVMAFLVSSTAFSINEWLVPWTNQQGEFLIRKIIYESPPLEMTENVFFKDKNRFFYIGKVQPDQHLLLNIIMYETNNEKASKMVTAKEGNYNPNLWSLREGVSHEFDENGFVKYEIGFSELQVAIEQNNDSLFKKQRSPDEMSRKELRELIVFFRDRGIDTTAMEVDYELKGALPLAAFIFVLLGAPLIIRARWHERFYSAGISVGIALLYFVLVSFVAAEGRAQMLPPIWAAWLPNIISLFLGIIGVWWADRR